MANCLSFYTDDELDSLIQRTARRLDRHAAALEAALDERERRDDPRQVALTAAAFTYLAAGETARFH